MNTTQIAQYAFDNGPQAAERPPYDSSPNGMAFCAGLWAREAGIYVYEAKQSRGYVVIINRTYKVDLKGNRPVVTRV